MTSLQTEWTEEELLASHPTPEPLIAGDVRCHGGFDADGAYVSPRTMNRWPAIDAWKEQRAEQFGTDLLDIPLDRWPENYPNVPQAKYLLSQGVREPVISTLTRIGTVEGFGSMIRYSVIPDLQQRFDEDVRGTAMWHLDKGLYEAHARDESGFEAEGGHKQMWFAARDVAFENPVTEDETAVMLQRMGFASANGAMDVQKMIKEAMANRVLPDDIPFELESLIERMARLMLIEISAYHVFAWAEEVLSDPDLTAGEGEAARIVSYIRQDEAPHVEYLKTTLSEMRDRTFVGTSGKQFSGTDVIGRIWDRAVDESLGIRREQNLKLTLREVEHAVAKRSDRDDVLEQFHSLGSIVPAARRSGQSDGADAHFVDAAAY
ncbi:MAG: uncharacterized protein QOG87_1402 [Actinomycetota bacterium]|jgi:hypothetical protein